MIRNTCYKAYTRHNITPRPPLPTPALPPVTIFSHQDTTQLFLLSGYDIQTFSNRRYYFHSSIDSFMTCRNINSLCT